MTPEPKTERVRISISVDQDVANALYAEAKRIEREPGMPRITDVITDLVRKHLMQGAA